MGGIAGQKGNDEIALKYFKTAVKIQPGSPVIQLNLGEAYRRLGQTTAAVSDFKRLARKPAPIQVTYLSNVSTTGLRTVDYRIGDRFLDPPWWRDPSYTEETLRMPHTTLCYTPPDEPETVASPFFATGRITFGSFNNFCKVNEAVLALWARILGAVPDSRLMMLVPKGRAQIQTRRFMESCGILAERLLLVERVPKEEYFWFTIRSISDSTHFPTKAAPRPATPFGCLARSSRSLERGVWNGWA